MRNRKPRWAQLTLRQRLLLAGIALIGSLLALACLEVGLRIAGYGSAYPLFVRFDPDPEYLVPNPEVGNRYFARSLDAPRPPFTPFRAVKPPNGIRIVVQGASTAAGFPYGFGGAFSAMLEQRLQRTFPDRAVEVVNASIGATNSYALADLTEEVIAVQPDAVLIYAGHNEYFGVLGVASAESIGRNPTIVRAYIALRKLRLVQLLRQAGASMIERLALNPASSEGRRTLMARLAAEQTVRYRSDAYEAAFRQYSSNLDRILRAYRAAGVPVFIGTIASNERDLQPLVSEPLDGVESAWRRWIVTSEQAIARDEIAAAKEALVRAAELDSTAGLAFYRYARLLDHPGSYDSARTWYVAAKDRDQLPFRAPERINEIINRRAAVHRARVVDSRGRLAAASDGGIIGRTLMLEHLHPNIEGQFLIAAAFFDGLREAGLFGNWSRAPNTSEARAEVPVTIVDSLAGAFQIERLTSGWPFREHGTFQVPAPDTMRSADPIVTLALQLYREQIAWPQVTERLREHYARDGAWQRALQVDLVMAQILKPSPLPYLNAARAALVLGRADEARAYLQDSYQREPTADAARLLGSLLAQSGKREQALFYLQQAARLDPTDVQASAALRAYRALPQLQRAAADDPRNARAWAELAAVYFLSGQYDAAEEAAFRALELEPANETANRVHRELAELPPGLRGGP